MSPKGKKSSSNVWSSCDDCGVVLTTKDSPNHCGQCPPDLNQWSCPFLKDDVLYSFIEVSDITDEPKISSHRKSLTIFLSQSAMQLCGFKIGEQVLLFLNNGSSVIRTVWPTTEKSLSSVIVPTNSNTNKKSMENKSRVKVMKLTQAPIPASTITLTTNEELDTKDNSQLSILCKCLYTGLVIKTRSELSIPFYGKNVLFHVKTVTPVNSEDEDTLIKNLEQLNINNDISKDEYFIACEETKWKCSQRTKVLSDDSVISNEITLKSVGGYKDIIKDLLSTISLALQTSTSYLPSIGYLLYGPNGVGKTYIAQAIANHMNVPVVKVNSGELFSKFYGETEVRLRDLFKEAKDQSPSVLLLDNVDTLCPKRGGTEQERRVIAYLLTLLDSLKHCRVAVLATTSQVSLIDAALRRPGRLDCEVEIPIPSVSDRCEILQVCLEKYSIDTADVQRLAEAAHGFVAADLQCLAMKSAMRAASRGGGAQVTADDLAWGLSQIKPSAMREVLVHVPKVKWTDIGGMEDLKLKLRQAIEWPLRHPESFTRLGIKPPRGVLMYGPPGCSKTMIAKALATESNLNFLSIKGSELFSKWVGESEKAVQLLFKRARAVAPSIVFLDELDALGGERSGGGEGSNVQERVLAQLLTEMDGVEPLGNVNIVAATNRPDRIDKALLRPGRLDRLVYVPLPDLATRSSILRIQLTKMPVDDDVTVEELALKTDGYSGAEVVSVCHEAAMSALQDDLNASTVQKRHFISALKSMKPRTPQSLIHLYEQYQSKR